MSLSLCRYRNSLGAPGRGVHTHVAGVAVVDLGLTLLAAWALARWLGHPWWWWALGLLAAGVAAHRLFCVRTAVDRFLFPGLDE